MLEKIKELLKSKKPTLDLKQEESVHNFDTEEIKFTKEKEQTNKIIYGFSNALDKNIDETEELSGMDYYNQFLLDIETGNVKLRESIQEAVSDPVYGETVQQLLSAKKHKDSLLKKGSHVETDDTKKFLVEKLDERISRYIQKLKNSNNELLKNIDNDIDHFLVTEEKVKIHNPKDLEMN